MFHHARRISDREIILNPVPDLTSFRQFSAHFKIRDLSAGDEDMFERGLELIGCFPQNILYCLAEVCLRRHTIHRSKSFVDRSIPQILVADSQAYSGHAKKGAQQVLGLVRIAESANAPIVFRVSISVLLTARNDL